MSILKLFFVCVGFNILSIPILEVLPEQIQPNSEILKYVILPFVSAVIIPFVNRILDRILPAKKEERKKLEKEKI